MRAFIIGCLAAAVIAIGAVFALNAVQKPAELGFSTSSVRI